MSLTGKKMYGIRAGQKEAVVDAMLREAGPVSVAVRIRCGLLFAPVCNPVEGSTTGGKRNPAGNPEVRFGQQDNGCCHCLEK